MTLFISHIPKTSGVSLRTVVKQHTAGAVVTYYPEPKWEVHDLSLLQSIRDMQPPLVIMGHFLFGMHTLCGLPPRYMTVLREPVDRVVSFYRFVKSLPDTRLGNLVNAGMTLREFVESKLTAGTNNVACRMIAGVAYESRALCKEKWLLDHAMHNLKNYYVIVGLFERRDQYLSRLANELGWPDAEMPQENVTKGDAIYPDAETLAIIRDYNALDIELYEAVASGALAIPS